MKLEHAFSLPNSGSDTSPAWQYGKPKSCPAFVTRFSVSGGTSSPSMSRPLFVYQSSFVDGCHAMPTLLRTPRATISKPVPSGFIRAMEAVRGSSGLTSHTLQGAPIVT